MSNSALSVRTKISPNKNTPRNHKIDTITIHVYVGETNLESMLEWFSQSSAQCSCNYCIDKDGLIGLCVDESDRSWCSSSASNDNRAVTIECASGREQPYKINNKVYSSLIKLVADICKRNNIKKLLWQNDASLVGNVAKQNVTLHRWFAAKECPGQYVIDNLPDIVKKVNAILADVSSNNDDQPDGTIYRVQVGAFSVRENAEKLRDELVEKGYKDAFIRE